jgi:hypothetical protein
MEREIIKKAAVSPFGFAQDRLCQGNRIKHDVPLGYPGATEDLPNDRVMPRDTPSNCVKNQAKLA